MINLPKCNKLCFACIHYCPKQTSDEKTDTYLCLIDNKIYVTSKINQNNEAICSCHNGKFKYNEDKFQNIRH